MPKLAFVGPHGPDRLRVSAGERFGDLLGRHRVVVRQRFAATQVTQLVEHDRPASVGALIGLNRGQLDLREPSELVPHLLLAQLVVAGDREPVLTWWAGCRWGITLGISRAVLA